MTKFKVHHDSYGYSTREPNPSDSWDRGDSAAVLSVRGLEVSEGYFDVALPAKYDPKKPLFLLWADYDSGDSFGRSGNRFEAVDVFQDAQRAYDAQQTLRAASTYSTGYVRDDGTPIDYGCPWVGYFESLNALHVEMVRVL